MPCPAVSCHYCHCPALSCHYCPVLPLLPLPCHNCHQLPLSCHNCHCPAPPGPLLPRLATACRGHSCPGLSPLAQNNKRIHHVYSARYASRGPAAVGPEFWGPAAVRGPRRMSAPSHPWDIALFPACPPGCFSIRGPTGRSGASVATGSTPTALHVLTVGSGLDEQRRIDAAHLASAFSLCGPPSGFAVKLVSGPGPEGADSAGCTPLCLFQFDQPAPLQGLLKVQSWEFSSDARTSSPSLCCV